MASSSAVDAPDLVESSGENLNGESAERDAVEKGRAKENMANPSVDDEENADPNQAPPLRRAGKASEKMGINAAVPSNSPLLMKLFKENAKLYPAHNQPNGASPERAAGYLPKHSPGDTDTPHESPYVASSEGSSKEVSSLGEAKRIEALKAAFDGEETPVAWAPTPGGGGSRETPTVPFTSPVPLRRPSLELSSASQGELSPVPFQMKSVPPASRLPSTRSRLSQPFRAPQPPAGGSPQDSSVEPSPFAFLASPAGEAPRAITPILTDPLATGGLEEQQGSTSDSAPSKKATGGKEMEQPAWRGIHQALEGIGGTSPALGGLGIELNPDCTLDLLAKQIHNEGKHRVRIPTPPSIHRRVKERKRKRLRRAEPKLTGTYKSLAVKGTTGKGKGRSGGIHAPKLRKLGVVECLRWIVLAAVWSFAIFSPEISSVFTKKELQTQLPIQHANEENVALKDTIDKRADLSADPLLKPKQKEVDFSKEPSVAILEPNSDEAVLPSGDITLRVLVDNIFPGQFKLHRNPRVSSMTLHVHFT